MHARRQQARPTWQRSAPERAHPLGRSRSPWPRAYDGGVPDPEPPAVRQRYRRAYDGDRRAEDRGTPRRTSGLERLRKNPLRNGLIGLAVAGTAAPIAVNRYQQEMRTDPSHERVLSVGQGEGPSDSSVANAWSALESKRESTIEANMKQYAAYDITRSLAEKIYDQAIESEIDPDIAFGLVRAESSFKNVSTSRVGAVGLTQLMPRTAEWLAPGTSVKELRDPDTNLRIGLQYLRQLIDKYNGNTDLALTAYNRGPGTVDEVLERGGDPDNGYAEFVRTGERGAHEG
ncbi:MAG TPA: lytic transglycosylase domain-containing protein [Longimicrobiaceae bacterium]|nr:lytic transglycosylase domain-containing protein [Longimicrobiaceae bacterium]